MSLIQTPWTSQPQQAVGIDWSNPITRGLIIAENHSNPRFAAFNAPTQKVGPSYRGVGGVATRFVSASSQYLKQSNTSLTNYPLTFLSVFQRASRPFDGVLIGIGAGTNRQVLYVNQDNIACFSGAGATTAQAASASNNLSASGPGDVRCAVGVVGAANNRLVYLDGVNLAFNGTTVSTGASNTAVIGCYWNNDAPSTYFNGDIYLSLAWNRALSDAEIRSISQNPWQIFKPLPRRIFVPVAAGDPTLYPSLYSNTNSFYDPSVSVGDVTLTPSLFSNSNTFHSATVTLGGSTQTLTPSLYSNTNTFHAPSVTTGAVTLTPSLVTNTNSFFGAVVTLDSDKILYPSLVSNSNSFYGPTVSVGAVSILPSLFVNSNTFYNHVVGGALTDSEKIDLILDILSNRQTLDATTGIYTLYADDGVTVLKTAQAWEDSEGTQPYRGRGLKRLDALQ